MTARILVCRPQPGADRTAQTLRDRGFSPVICPLLQILPTDTPCPINESAIGALVVTSRQAVEYVHKFRDKPAYAVGRATADALSQAGFTRIRATDSDAKALSDAVPGYLVLDGLAPSAHILWPCAREPAFDMVAALEQRKIACWPWAVYTAEPLMRLPSTIARQLAGGGINSVLLTSPRIAATFATLTPTVPDNTRLLCFSEAVRLALPEDLRDRAQAASEPNEQALLSLL